MAINDVFPVGLKREVVTALEPLFGNDFPIPELRNKVYVGLDYPERDITYPAIMLNFSVDQIQNAGLGHYDMDDTDTVLYRHFIFTGRLTFAIIASTPRDRDELSATIVQILAMGQVIPAFASFHDEIRDNDYIMLQLMTDTITPSGEQAGTVPWGDPDEIVFSNSYSVQVYGEFYSDAASGDLIAISEIDIYPYPTGDPIP